MNIETNAEKLDNTEEKSLEVSDRLTNSTPLIREDQIKLALAERFKKLEQIKDVINPKTYQIVLTKLQNEEKEILAEFIKEQEQRTERERVTQVLPKAYFEQRFLRVKEIRID